MSDEKTRTPRTTPVTSSATPLIVTASGQALEALKAVGSTTAQLAASSPYYHPRGILKIYALEGTRLTYVTEAEIAALRTDIAALREHFNKPFVHQFVADAAEYVDGDMEVQWLIMASDYIPGK